MKQPLLKPVLMVALCVCIAITLFSTLSPARTAYAATNRAAVCSSGTTTNIRLGTIWYPGNHTYATACDGGQLDLTYQTDGNFVLYHNGHAIWATGTDFVNNLPFTLVPYYTSFQNDGNLVVYSIPGGQNPSPPPTFADWSSHTNGIGATTLALQRDGNLVIYRGFTPLWSSHTNFY